MPLLIRATLTLATVTFIAALGLYLVNEATAEQIAAQKKAVVQNSLKLVLPEADPQNLQEHQTDELRYWVWKDNGQVRGYAYTCSKYGYSSAPEIMVGVQPDGTIIGIRVMSQAETPGLGARMQEVPASQTLWQALLGQGGEGGARRPWFEQQFAGRDAGRPITIKKNAEWPSLTAEQQQQLTRNNDITSISGATISTIVVRDAIREGFATLKKLQQG